MNCEICGNHAVWSWTDYHGVAQCYQCGSPYRIFHYEGEGEAHRRVDKPPQLLVKPDYVPLAKDYWNQFHRRIPSGHSFPGGQELATAEDARAFDKWLDSKLKSA